MDFPSPRATTAFICHPNAISIAREIDLAMAHCGLLPKDGDAQDASSHEVQLMGGAGMWHVLHVAPSDGLWLLVNEAGEPLLQLLCSALAAPGFVTVFEQDDPAGEVFVEVDAQGQLRAAGEWKGQAHLGEIQLSSPVQAFSTGLRLLWSQGLAESNAHGLDLTPVAAFLRVAMQRLAGGQDAAVVFSGRYAPGQEPALSEFIAQKMAERTQFGGDPDSLAPSADDGPPDAPEPQDAVPPASEAAGESTNETASETAQTQAKALHYADGKPVEAGDAVAIDGGMTSARVRALLADAGWQGGFRVTLDLAGQQRDLAGATFLTRATLVQSNAATFTYAEAAVVSALRARADGGDVQAMLILGIRLLRGAGMDKDPRQAYVWLHGSAKQGNALAQYLVGVMSRDPERSVKYWRLAADQGHAPAQFCLGLAHVRGNSALPVNAEEGKAWLAQAARQGHLAATYDLAVLNAGTHQSLVDDPDAKLSLFAARAEVGDPVASWLLGLAVQNGLADASLDVNRVVEFLGEAVTQKYEPAYTPLAALLSRFEIDPGVRERVCQRLQEQASADLALAHMALGESMLGGDTDSLRQGLAHLHKAAAAGSLAASERIEHAQIELMANASALRAQAIGATADERAALLPQLMRSAAGLECIAEGKVAVTGPNTRMQMLGLYQAAADLGDADAAAQLKRLEQMRGDSDWEQAQALAELEDRLLPPEQNRQEALPEEDLHSLENPAFNEALDSDLPFTAVHEAGQHVAAHLPEDAADEPNEEKPHADAARSPEPEPDNQSADAPDNQTQKAPDEQPSLAPNAAGGDDEAPSKPSDQTPDSPDPGHAHESDVPAPASARKPWWKIW